MQGRAAHFGYHQHRPATDVLTLFAQTQHILDAMTPRQLVVMRGATAGEWRQFLGRPLQDGSETREYILLRVGCQMRLHGSQN